MFETTGLIFTSCS